MPQSSLEQQLADAYDEYADALFRHCYFRVHERELGKELMQQAFMKVWEYMVAGKEIENLRALLYKTANNLIIDYARRAKLRTEESYETLQEGGFDIASSEDSTKQADLHFTEQQVHALLAQVKEPYKTAVIMRFIDELAPAEIAKSLGISASNASARITRGLALLKTALKAYE